MSAAGTKDDKQLDHEVQFLLAEYAYEQKRLETSLSTINQTLTIYGILTGILTALAANLINIFWKDHRQGVWIGLSLILPLCAILTTLTLFRHFQARMQQTDAERAICRIRRYFVTKHPNVSGYVTGRINDNWPTPYTHRWRSMTHVGWLVLIALSGLLAAVSTLILMKLTNYNWSGKYFSIALSIVSGTLYSLSLLIWLNSRLKRRIRSHDVRFSNDN